MIICWQKVCKTIVFTTKTHTYATSLQTMERQKVTLLLPFWVPEPNTQTAKVCKNRVVPVQTAPKGKPLISENQYPITQTGKTIWKQKSPRRAVWSGIVCLLSSEMLHSKFKNWFPQDNAHMLWVLIGRISFGVCSCEEYKNI